MSREDEKYSVVEDAAPQSTSQLEKGLYVLYKISVVSSSTNTAAATTASGNNAGSTSFSHSSTPTPTTPTSPDHSNLSSHSANYPLTSSSSLSASTGGSPQIVRYRLGKIIDFKDKLKSYLVQPVCLKAASSLPTSTATNGEILSSDLISAEWVKRPNLRLITPPWFTEFKNELGLRSNRDIHLHMLISFSPPPPPPPITSVPLIPVSDQNFRSIAHMQRNQVLGLQPLMQSHSISDNKVTPG